MIVQEPISQLDNYQQVWKSKKVLRVLYQAYYDLIASYLCEGKTLEIGGGCGNIKTCLDTEMVSIDIQYSPSLDMVADAEFLPFKNEVFSNIVLFDVLHHLQNVPGFLDEARRVLKPCGKIIMIEPGITPVSYVFYKYFHEEDVNMSDKTILDKNKVTVIDKDPYDSNQAIPTLLFKKNLSSYKQCYPDLKPVKVSWLSLWAYPLSGGFKKWSLIPAIMAKILLPVEKILLPLIGRVAAFRLFIVLEKNKNNTT